MTKGKPLIAIPCRLRELKEPLLPMVGVNQSYTAAITALGGIPMLVPIPLAVEDALALYERADGLLLAGGEDISPKEYNESVRPECGTTSVVRDSVELALARCCLAAQKPILGICRGIQVLNVALGGTLYQDIATECSTSIRHDRNPWHELTHPISLKTESALAEILGTVTLDVNSLHHQSIDKLAPGLSVSARSPDGVIEAVEGVGPGFVIGVQCHPEVLWDRVDTRWADLFLKFVAACSK